MWRLWNGIDFPKSLDLISINHIIVIPSSNFYFNKENSSYSLVHSGKIKWDTAYKNVLVETYIMLLTSAIPMNLI